MLRLHALVHLVMRTDVEKDDHIFELYIDDSYIPCHRESTLASKFTCKRMIIERIAKFSGHEQGKSSLELIYKLCVRTDS